MERKTLVHNEIVRINDLSNTRTSETEVDIYFGVDKVGAVLVPNINSLNAEVDADGFPARLDIVLTPLLPAGDGSMVLMEGDAPEAITLAVTNENPIIVDLDYTPAQGIKPTTMRFRVTWTGVNPLPDNFAIFIQFTEI